MAGILEDESRKEDLGAVEQGLRCKRIQSLVRKNRLRRSLV